MKRTLKSFCILILISLIPLTMLPAEEAQTYKDDALTYENAATGLRKKIGHYEFWRKEWQDAHRPSNQMTRIELGWNYWLRSLIDPIYEEAAEKLGEAMRLTDNSVELGSRYVSFNQGKGTFDWILTLKTGFANVDIPVSIPYEKFSGKPWPSNDAPYTELRDARLRAQQISDSISNHKLRVLFDIEFTVRRTQSTGRYQLVISNCTAWNRDGKEPIMSFGRLPVISFSLNTNNFAPFAGSVPFSLDILDKRLTTTDPARFGRSAQPFGLEITMEQLSTETATAIRADIDAENEKRNEEERAAVAEREAIMEKQDREAYEEKLAVHDMKQDAENRLQAKWDEEFEKKKAAILSEEPSRSITVKAEWKGKHDLFQGYAVLAGGAAYPFSAAEEPGALMKANGSFMYSPVLSGTGTVGAVVLDTYASGSVLGMEEGKKADFITAYIGAGPGFAFGPEKFPMMLTLSGGLALDMDREADGEFSYMVDPALKCSLHMDFSYVGLDAGVLFGGESAEAYAALSFSFLGMWI